MVNRLKPVEIRQIELTGSEKLALKAKMDWKYYGMIERGELTCLLLETIEKLAKAFEVELFIIAMLSIFTSDDPEIETEVIDEEFQ